MSLSQKNETKATIESLKDKVKPMNTNFKRLEANVSVAKAVNSISMKIQRQCWDRIPGIPTSTRQHNLE